MPLNNRTYRALPPRAIDNNRVFSECIFTHHDPRGAEAYINNPEATGDNFQLRYAGSRGISLSDEHQLLEVNLVRSNGAPALTGMYLVDMVPNKLATEEVLVSHGRQFIPLAGYADLKPGVVLSFVAAPFLRVPLETVRDTDLPEAAHSSITGPVLPDNALDCGEP